MKKCYVLCAFFWCATTVCAQIQQPSEILLTTTDTTKGQLLPHRMILVRDGGFITAGSLGQKAYLSKISGCGQFLWSQEYLIGSETDLNSLTELPSGEIVAVGSCSHCAPMDTTLKALVIKTSSEGQLLLDTSFGNLNYHAQAFDVITTGDGKAALTGYVDFLGFLGPSNAFLSVLDAGLHPEIWKQYNHAYRETGNALTKCSDGGFVLAGYSVAAFLEPRQAQMFRVDAAGNLMWKYTSPHLSSEFNDVEQAADGKIITLGDRLVDTVSERDVFLTAHQDGTGNLLEEKLYGSPASDVGNSLELVADGYLIGAIYGQPSQTGWSTRDWVFKLNEQFELVDQYFRDDYLFGHSLRNAVALSSDGKSFAFHSVLNLYGCYCPSLIFFKRTFQGNLSVLTKVPMHYQLVPRNLINNKGTVVFEGTVDNADAFDQMQLDILRNEVWQSTLYDNTPQSFLFTPEINAEPAEYSFRLYGVKDQHRYPESEVCEIVAGDAYFIQGQSNAVAGIPAFDTQDTIDHAYRHHTSPFIRNFGLKYANDTLFAWRKETGKHGNFSDNLSGQWGLILGKNIVDQYGIPVAIINGAISGISIDSMMPDPLFPANPATRYGRFLQRVERSGLKDHIRAKLMFQGETNAAGGFWNSANAYYQKFLAMDDAWNQDFPAVLRGYFFQIRPGAYFAGATLLTCLQVEEAQRRIAETVPEWQIMSTTGMDHDGTHYYYPNGYERAGQDISRLVLHDLYGAPATDNIYPPTVDALHFAHCDHKEIVLQLRHTNDSYFWTPGWERDFRLEGNLNDSILSGQVIGSTIVLTLSAAPGPGFTGLSYTSHPVGSDASVKNANGIGMLTFYNLPVLNQNDPPIILTDTLIVADNGTSNGSIEVTPMNGNAPYTYQWSTGATTATLASLSAGVYSLTITDVYQCKQSFIFTVPLTIGTVASGSEFCAKIFPNPCMEYLDFQWTKNQRNKDYEITITNILGKEVIPVIQTRGALTRIPTGELPSGTYLLTLWNEGTRRWSEVFVKS